MFNKRLKELREKNELSQYKLAQELGVVRMTINYYENGKRVPDINFLIKVAEYFGVSVNYLLGRTPSKSDGEREFTNNKLQLLDGIIDKLPTQPTQELIDTLYRTLKDAYDYGVEDDVLYLITNAMYQSRSIVQAVDKFEAACESQKYMADAIYYVAKSIKEKL